MKVPAMLLTIIDRQHQFTITSYIIYDIYITSYSSTRRDIICLYIINDQGFNFTIYIYTNSSPHAWAVYVYSLWMLWSLPFPRASKFTDPLVISTLSVTQNYLISQTFFSTSFLFSFLSFTQFYDRFLPTHIHVIHFLSLYIFF